MSILHTRSPVVAGSFYARDPAALRASIERCFEKPRGPGTPIEADRNPSSRTSVIGGIVPHAGYTYSGPIAAHFFARLASEPRPAAILLLGVNHQGLGGLFSLSDEEWRTPLGVVPTDRVLLQALARPPLEIDGAAHRAEHSIEVELPFLQCLWAEPLPIVALQVTFTDLDLLKEVGKIVADAVSGKDIILLASTDLSHYLPPKEARRLDDLAIAAILTRSPDKLYKTVVANDISMCGIAPTTVLLSALEDMEAKPRLLAKGSSGDAEPMETVVGYASFLFER